MLDGETWIEESFKKGKADSDRRSHGSTPRPRAHSLKAKKGGVVCGRMLGNPGLGFGIKGWSQRRDCAKVGGWSLKMPWPSEPLAVFLQHRPGGPLSPRPLGGPPAACSGEHSVVLSPQLKFCGGVLPPSAALGQCADETGGQVGGWADRRMSRRVDWSTRRAKADN